MGATQREKILEECSRSLLGRFLTTKPYNQRAAKELPRSVWKFGTNLRIVDVEDGLFQFKFTLESQLKWVLNNSPWSFDNYPLFEQGNGIGEKSIHFLNHQLGWKYQPFPWTILALMTLSCGRKISRKLSLLSQHIKLLFDYSKHQLGNTL